MFEVIVTDIGLSMDAFAVSISKGLSCGKYRLKNSLITGAYFGGFQAAMPLIGFFLAGLFAKAKFITDFDHWIAFVLLALIGGNMIREAFSKEEEQVDASFGFKAMLPLAVATSIDAMVVGVNTAFLENSISIYITVAVIGVITFLFSAAGVKIGNVFGEKYKAKAEFVGGLILILMGTKILIEHLTGAA